MTQLAGQTANMVAMDGYNGEVATAAQLCTHMYAARERGRGEGRREERGGEETQDNRMQENDALWQVSTHC